MGPAPLPVRNLTGVNLASELTSLVHDSRLRANAEHLGRRLNSEDGLGRAVQILEHHVATS